MADGEERNLRVYLLSDAVQIVYVQDAALSGHAELNINCKDQCLLLDLLKHLPSQLPILRMVINHSTSALAYKHICPSFPTFERLTIHCSTKDYLSVQTCKDMAESIANLPKLKRIELQLLGCKIECPQKCCSPIVKAIRSNIYLARVDCLVSGGFSANDRDAMQFGPRLHQARTQHQLSDPPQTLEEFLKALMAVRDRVDCLHYFISKSDGGIPQGRLGETPINDPPSNYFQD